MWEEYDNKLNRAFEFHDFREAIAFIQLVAFAAESKDHHPEIYNLYARVNLSLSTHSAGNIVTDKDVALAKIIDSIYTKHFSAK